LTDLVCAIPGGGFVAGDPVTTCPSGGLCFSIAVPTSSANAGSGNIYFQIKAPTSLQWVALGTGSSMSGSNIFLVYQDGKGNVTLSPRLARGYSMPTLDTSSSAARLTLLGGSGVSDDGSTMTANVACSNCQSWSGGSMSLKSTGAGWIGAWKEGSALATTDRDAGIAQHDSHTQFRVDLTRATINSDSNPFFTTRTAGGGSDSGSGSGSDTNSGSGSGSGSGTNSGSGSGSGSGNGSGAGSGNGNGNGSGSDSDAGRGGSNAGNGITVTTGGSRNAVLVAHGVIMALVMAALYPLGSLLMPLVGKWWVHAGWQAITFCLMWAGFGLGVVVARERQMVSEPDPKSLFPCDVTELTTAQLFNQAHSIFGTIVIALFAVQPVLGFLHHQHFLKTQGRGLVSYVHIWWGRILMALGVINGGIGLRLAQESDGPVIAYSVVAGVVFFCYTGFKVCNFFRGGVHTAPRPAKEEPAPAPRAGDEFI